MRLHLHMALHSCTRPFAVALTPFSAIHRPLKAQLQAELGAAADADQQEAIRAAFSAREKAIEHDIDHKPMDVHMCLDVAYNVSACSLPAPSKFCLSRVRILTPVVLPRSSCRSKRPLYRVLQ